MMYAQFGHIVTLEHFNAVVEPEGGIYTLTRRYS